MMNEQLKNNQNNNMDTFLEENTVVFKKYKPILKIDRGAFGNIYAAIRLKDKTIFAMKTEDINAQQKTLESEAYYLIKLQGGIGFPNYITFGHTKKYNILIETLLGKSLSNLFIKTKKKCNLIDVCLIGHQILDRLEWIHSKNLIYRDIKPENFLIGRKNQNIIYIVDFGLCKKYRFEKTGKHIPPKYTGRFNGTLIYASPNIVKGKESSRRDDLISLGYMLIYLYKRNLPWESNFKNLDKKKYQELIYLKDTNGYMKLFENIPSEFEEYINYSRNLKFDEDPNYSYLRSLFEKILFKFSFNTKKLCFSWINQKISRNQSLINNKNKNKKKNLSDVKTMIVNNLRTDSMNYKALGNNISFPHELNVISEKIYLNKSNININNIKLGKFYLNNTNNINLTNINTERILNKKDTNSNQISQILYLNTQETPSSNIENNIINKNTINKNYYNKIDANKKRKGISSINFKSSNLKSEKINFKNFSLYANNIENNKIKAKNRLDNNLTTPVNICNNIMYKSPLLNNKNLIANKLYKKNDKEKNIYSIEKNNDIIHKKYLNTNKSSIYKDRIYQKINNMEDFDLSNDNNYRKRNVTPNFFKYYEINDNYDNNYI